MNTLIKIEPRTLSGSEIQTCNARELHAFLEVEARFNDWITRRIEEYGFVEGKDFYSFLSKTPSGGRPAKEYALTLDMAKELSMVERNEKGKQARQYFLECERKAKEAANRDPMQLLSDPAAMRGLLLNYTEKVLTLESKVTELSPKADALDRISASSEALTITQAAKVLGVKRETLTHRLQIEGWVYRQNGSWVGYAQHIKNGSLQYKEANYTDDKTGQNCIRPYCHIMPKGMAKLALMFGQQDAA